MHRLHDYHGSIWVFLCSENRCLKISALRFVMFDVLEPPCDVSDWHHFAILNFIETGSKIVSFDTKNLETIIIFEILFRALHSFCSFSVGCAAWREDVSDIIEMLTFLLFSFFRLQRKWLKTQWTRNLEQHGMQWSEKVMALKSPTRPRTFCIFSSVETWQLCFGSVHRTTNYAINF